MRRRPQRGAAHQVVAVAKRGDRQPAAAAQGQRGADRHPGPGADPAATVAAERVKRMRHLPGIVGPGERAADQRGRARADRLAQRRGQHQGLDDVAGADPDRRRGRRLPSRPAGLSALDERQERGDRDVGLDREMHIGRRQALVVHAPAVVHKVVERGEDDLGRDRLRAAGRLEGAGKIDPVEAQDDIGLADKRAGGLARVVAGGRSVQRVARRETGPGLGVGQDDCAQRLGQLHAALPLGFAARGAADEDQRALRGSEQRRGLVQRRRVGRRRRRRAVAGVVGQHRQRAQFALLQRGVEADVSGPLRWRRRHPVGAQQRLGGGRDRGRLVVPFGEVADQRALVLRGMDPVDPRPPQAGLHRPIVACISPTLLWTIAPIGLPVTLA